MPSPTRNSFNQRFQYIKELTCLINGSSLIANSQRPAKSFVLVFKSFNMRQYQALQACLPHIGATLKPLYYAGPNALSDHWMQMFLLTPSAPLPGSRLLGMLQRLVPEITWDPQHSQLRAVLIEANECRIRDAFPNPKSAMPPLVEPRRNEDAVLCHFTTFKLAMELYNAILKNELKAKKRDFATLAKLLMPIYEKFAVFINSKRVYFYNSQTRLWDIDPGIERSVGFLIGLLRDFFEEPFRRYQEGLAEINGLLDIDLATQLTTLGKLFIDLGTTAPRNQLTKQLVILAEAQVNGKEDDTNLKFGRDREWLSFRNGIDINVYSGKKRIRTREHRQVYSCAIDWIDRPEPNLLKRMGAFLMTIASQQRARLNHLLVEAFVILTGNNHKFIFINVGRTGNSKSTFMNLLKRLLGDFSYEAHPSIFYKTKRTATAHTGFMSQLALRRLIILDDNLDAKTQLDLTLLKRMTTPGTLEPVRDCRAPKGYKIDLCGPVAFILNPDFIPKNLNLGTDAAMQRRVIILEYLTHFIAQAMYDQLSPEEKDSGFFAVKDDALIEEMKTEPMLQALCHLILKWGRQVYRDRMKARGEIFTPDIDLIKKYFPQDFDDFDEWWKAVTELEPDRSLDLPAIAQRYTTDHPGGQKALDPKQALILVRNLDPSPSISQGRVQGYRFKSQTIPTPVSVTGGFLDDLGEEETSPLRDDPPVREDIDMFEMETEPSGSDGDVEEEGEASTLSDDPQDEMEALVNEFAVISLRKK